MRKKRILAWMLIAALTIADSSVAYAAETGEIEEIEGAKQITEETGELEEEVRNEEEIAEEQQEVAMEDVLEDERQQSSQQLDEGDMEEFQPAEQTENSSASETTVFGDYECSIDDNLKTVTITKYVGEETILNVPEEINGYRVVAIGDDAFRYCSSLTDVNFC